MKRDAPVYPIPLKSFLMEISLKRFVGFSFVFFMPSYELIEYIKPLLIQILAKVVIIEHKSHWLKFCSKWEQPYIDKIFFLFCFLAWRRSWVYLHFINQSCFRRKGNARIHYNVFCSVLFYWHQFSIWYLRIVCLSLLRYEMGEHEKAHFHW